jgi:cytochrome c biogenesis protein CcmG/thiol:disulfide interchange protein DsbE
MRWLYTLPLVVFIALVMILAIALRQPHSSAPESMLLGKTLPEFALPSVFADAPPVTSTRFLGKPFLVNIFASWCMSCLIEHPVLMEFTKKTGIPIIGIDWKDKDATIRTWLKQHGNPYAAIGADHDGRVAIDLGVTGAPESFLVDASGKVLYRFPGVLTDEVIASDIMPRLALRPLEGGGLRRGWLK